MLLPKRLSDHLIVANLDNCELGGTELTFFDNDITRPSEGKVCSIFDYALQSSICSDRSTANVFPQGSLTRMEPSELLV